MQKWLILWLLFTLIILSDWYNREAESHMKCRILAVRHCMIRACIGRPYQVVDITNTSLELEFYFNPHYPQTNNTQPEYERKPSIGTNLIWVSSYKSIEDLEMVSWIPKFLITIFIGVIS